MEQFINSKYLFQTVTRDSMYENFLELIDVRLQYDIQSMPYFSFTQETLTNLPSFANNEQFINDWLILKSPDYKKELNNLQDLRITVHSSDVFYEEALSAVSELEETILEIMKLQLIVSIVSEAVIFPEKNSNGQYSHVGMTGEVLDLLTPEEKLHICNSKNSLLLNSLILNFEAERLFLFTKNQISEVKFTD